MAIYDPDTHAAGDNSDQNFPLYDPPAIDEGKRDPSGQLDPERKSREKPPPDPQNRSLIFRKHRNADQQLTDWMLRRCPDEALTKRVLSCGSDAWVDQSPSTGRFRIRCQRCGYRACPVCRTRWALHVRDKIEVATTMATARRLKLCTLTLRSSSAPLRKQIDHLWWSFRKLRDRTIWKNAVDGCIAVVEITWNEKRSQWHPHLHCIIESDYLDARKLSKQWLQITLTSKIVDVRALRDAGNVGKYLTAYLMKATELPPDLDDEKKDEYFSLFKGGRFVRFYGTLRPKKGVEPVKPPYPEDWAPLMPLGELLRRAAEGDDFASHLLRCLTAERALEHERPATTDPPPSLSRPPPPTAFVPSSRAAQTLPMLRYSATSDEQRSLGGLIAPQTPLLPSPGSGFASLTSPLCPPEGGCRPPPARLPAGSGAHPPPHPERGQEDAPPRQKKKLKRSSSTGRLPPARLAGSLPGFNLPERL